jgi:hypothetical protein
MFHQLESEGPFSYSEMKIRFGRRWRTVWRSLRDKGLVKFALNARHARHYQLGRDELFAEG